ncbi:hypothetical protein Btru_038660 [Bulinus truncatus]|nr:hypothetical protein Btru_038660 [Bulinus truncatus]
MEAFRALSVIVCYLVAHSLAMDADNDSAILDYDRLRNDLLRRPVIAHQIPADVDTTTSDPLVLNITFYLAEVVGVDQIEQLMTVTGMFYFTWMHRGLTWDPSSYGGLDDVVMATAELWVPQLAVWIGDKDSTTLSYPDQVNLNSSGFVTCYTLSQVTFRCLIDVRKFPFDTQTCSFGPFILNQRLNAAPARLKLERQTNVMWGMSVKNPYTIMGEWLLQNFTIGSFREDTGREYPHFVLTVKRQWLYYVIVVIFPMVVTSIMIPLVFLIPKNSGEKISYLVTMYTSTAVFLSYISQVMPKNLANNTPYLAILLTEVISLGLCATLAALWVVLEDKISCFVKMKSFTDDKMAVIGNEKRQETREPEAQVEPCDVKVIRSETRLTGCQLDLFFFCLFSTGQAVFLVTLFCGTNWLD